MSIESTKEMKCVVTSLSIGAIVVFISAVVEKSIIDFIYGLCIIFFLIRYIIICKES